MRDYHLSDIIKSCNAIIIVYSQSSEKSDFLAVMQIHWVSKTHEWIARTSLLAMHVILDLDTELEK